MFRVLQVIGSMGMGGAETMLMNYYRHIDRERVQFDFVVHTDQEQAYDREIEALGGKIWHTEKFDGRNYFSYRRWWREFLQEHPEYRIVHGHIGSSAAVYLYEAKRQGRYTIAHSHNTRAVGGRKIHSMLWEAFSYPTRYIADYYFACSQDAGRDRFGTKVASSERFQVLPNAIDCKRFAFSEEQRSVIRKKYGLDGCFVIGHVGRFDMQKNHEKLLGIFNKVHGKDSGAKLILLGGGNNQLKIQRMIHELGLDEAVVLAGVQKNTEDYYSAMDAFCFPSLWEGFGISLLEAQASGLRCVVSEAIMPEVDIGAGLLKRCSLKESDEVWADALLSYKNRERTENAIACAKESGYDIVEATRKLENFYLKRGASTR